MAGIKISVHSGKQSMFTNCDPSEPVLMYACQSNNYCVTSSHVSSPSITHLSTRRADSWYRLRWTESHTNTHARTRTHAITNRDELLLVLHNQHLLEADIGLAGQVVHLFMNISPTSQGTGSLILDSGIRDLNLVA